MRNPFRRRRSMPEETLRMWRGTHEAMADSFIRHRYSEKDAYQLADIAFEGWLDYIREEM